MHSPTTCRPFLAGLGLVLLHASAEAMLCSKCRDKVFDNQFGTCRECRGNTHSTYFQLCPQCSATTRRCACCYELIGEQAEQRTPPRIDMQRTATYQFKNWAFRLEVERAGGKVASRNGRLAYAGTELDVPAINDYYRTPWGDIYWVGNKGPGGSRGWSFRQVSGELRGRLLDPPVPAAKEISLTLADNGRRVNALVGSEIVVRLSGELGSGSRWKLSTIAGDAVTAVSRRPTYVPDKASAARSSRAGTYVFKLNAEEAGTSTVEFQYGKTASSFSKPDRTMKVTISVQAAP